ncbi:hypothetical protein J2S43_005194 [Catenuloplanes nepalensis]|uniref:Uncharacterized protein n=1 Tax=Catenuloplanes nepalensis TaxID=587533 RepID=A0ABT9MZ20_9ACTN|nr:hypothetical protein [Catenuloplanes nepalensis]MDP9796682.1 hypothetical protein [Catenuloplanes nepalensis]
MRLQHLTRFGAVASGALALALAVTAAPASAADADIMLKGGDGNSTVVCGNVAAALSLAKKAGYKLQLNNCKANAAGGSVGLSNLEIFVSQSAAKTNASALAALDRAANITALAADKCENHRAKNTGQMTKCWATAKGGKVYLNNVTVQKGNVARTIAAGSLARTGVPKGTNGGAGAKCWNVVSDKLNQRDDCNTFGGGAVWALKGVDVKGYNGEGLRKNVSIEVRGGDANNYVLCFNTTDGSGKVKQINICSAEGKGGDVTLKNIKIITL